MVVQTILLECRVPHQRWWFSATYDAALFKFKFWIQFIYVVTAQIDHMKFAIIIMLIKSGTDSRFCKNVSRVLLHADVDNVISGVCNSTSGYSDIYRCLFLECSSMLLTRIWNWSFDFYIISQNTTSTECLICTRT